MSEYIELLRSVCDKDKVDPVEKNGEFVVITQDELTRYSESLRAKDKEEIAKLQQQVACDHDWEFQDDSFDHEFGTEQVHYWLCVKCDATRPMEAGDYDYE